MTPEQVDQQIATMTVYWPHQPLEPASLAVWRDKLAKLDDVSLVQSATARLMETTKFWPHWSEFVAMYRVEVKAERRESSTVHAVTPPMERVDHSGAVFAALRQAITPGPITGRVAVEQLYELLTDAWGTGFDPDRQWVNRMERMELAHLGATVDAAIEKWPDGTPTWRSTSWKEFGKMYLSFSDAEAVEQLRQARQATTV